MDIDSISSINPFLNGNLVNSERNTASGIANFESLLRNTAATGADAEKKNLSSKTDPEQNSSRFAVIDRDDKLYEQCVEMEIFLVKNLISSMRNTVQKSGLIEEGFAGKMYEDMLYDEYAKDFAKNAGLGMADLAYLELSGQRGKIVQS
jgi:flagellar protein FlgJ